MQRCEWCSDEHNEVSHTGKCPKVKAIEYYDSGAVKRVEFYGPEDYIAPFGPYVGPLPDTPVPPYKTTVSDNTSNAEWVVAGFETGRFNYKES